MRVNELKIGQKATILALAGGAKAYRQRLIAMGLIPGTELMLTRIAPLGDPIEIHVRGVALCLRQHEAAILELENTDDMLLRK